MPSTSNIIRTKFVKFDKGCIKDNCMATEKANSIEEFIKAVKQKVEEKNVNLDKTANSQKEIDQFETQFDGVNKMIELYVNNVNNLFEKENINYKFFVIHSKMNDSPTRKAIQVVLTEDEHKFNLLENPYLLVEAFANDGNVRIVNSGSVDLGTTLKLNELNQSDIDLKIKNLIQDSIK